MIRYECVNEKGRALADAIKERLGDHEGEAVVFIGALGICVRKVLPGLSDKRSDPAVVCVDSLGRYAIPVVGGHAGGANALAARIARAIGARAVITTQSDAMGLWALDTLDSENGWGMAWDGSGGMNAAIAAFVSGEPTALVLEHRDRGTEFLERTRPAHVTVYHGYGDFLLGDGERDGGRRARLLLTVSPRLHPSHGIPCLRYFPRCLHLGVGCQRNLPELAAGDILAEVERRGYARQSIATVATIDIKGDEPVVGALGRALPWASVITYGAGELRKVDVPNPSGRVERVTGSPSVAEGAAVLASGGGSLFIEKAKGRRDGLSYTFALASQRVPRGHVEIVGAGPGDPDLVSVRGRRFLEAADLILYAGSLVPEALTRCAKDGALVRNSATMTLREQLDLMREHYDRGELVVRLHTGDPCIYGAIGEQMAYLDAHGMDYHITPGISSFLAAAAELGSELTIPGECQSVILTRRGGRIPVPGREGLRLLASHQGTMCIFLSAALAREVQEELLQGGYPADTPVAVCHRLTWEGQRIFRGRLSELADIVEGNGLGLTTMIVVGRAIGNREGASRLYDEGFTHLYREGK